MAKVDVLDILKAKRVTPAEFNFDSLWIPPIYNYLSPQDIDSLRKIATSIRLSSKINQKYEMIDNIMRFRGFKRFAAGTNRVVYSFLEDDRFVVKIAVDKVGMQDNPREYENQFLLKPYVAKMFYISPCGTVGFAERVLPIKNKAEFKEIAGDVFDILVHKILGKYVMEDIGSKFFMNYGIRRYAHPVLLDYPYVYKLDGKKLYCNKTDPLNNIHCNGEIDYDAGFNHLVCEKCGKIYLASDLRDDSIDNKIIIKRGGTQMKVVLKEGDKVVYTPIQTEDVITRREKRPEFKSTKGLVVKLNTPEFEKNETVSDKDESLNTSETVNSDYVESNIDTDVEVETEAEPVEVDDTVENSDVEKKSYSVEEGSTSEDNSVISSEKFAELNAKLDAAEARRNKEKSNSSTEIEVKTPNKPARNSKGQFISTKKNKTKSSFIVPSK